MSDAVETPAPASAARHKTLQDELLHLIAVQSQRVPIAAFLAALIIAGFSIDYVPPYLCIGWVVAVTVVLVIRFAILQRLPTMTNRNFRSRIRIVIGLSLLNGLMHASSLVFFPFLPEVERAIQTVILVALSTGAVATTAGYLPVFLGYMLPSFAVMVPLWLISPGLPEAGLREAALGLLVFMFGAILVGLARNAWKVFRESFDIRSEMMQLNEKLSQALKGAEAANNAKTRFLASASHDLRQPIHTLSLFGAALSMRTLDSQTKEIVSHMNVALKNLASQLDSLLDISKLDAGVIDKNVSVIDLKTMLRNLSQEYLPLCEEKGITLKFALLEQLPAIKTDALLFERIIRNLLSNAVKYTDEGSVYLTTVQRDGQLAIRVSDTGRGIAAIEQAHIFEEFYQIDNPERDRSKGLGLGLSIVQRLTQMLDIELVLTSTHGKGSRFELRLNDHHIVNQSVAQEAAENVLGPLAHSTRILVIDDEAAVCVGMQSLLSEMGYDVDLAESTEQALEIIRIRAPQLVLADLRLRGTDNGIDCIHALRALIPDLPALLISGDTAPNRLRGAHLAGIEMLHKPVDVELLHRTISKLLPASINTTAYRDVGAQA